MAVTALETDVKTSSEVVNYALTLPKWNCTDLFLKEKQEKICAILLAV